MYTKLKELSSRGAFMLSAFSIIIIFYEYGFKTNLNTEIVFHIFYLLTLLLGISSQSFRFQKSKEQNSLKVQIVDGAFLIVFILVFISSIKFDLRAYIADRIFLVITCLFIFLRELSSRNFKFKKKYLNPAQLFVLSFLLVMFTGALLLMLPEATVGYIEFIDALFTSTSAVSVTGLAVVDTGQAFSRFGQTIIAVLIQVGGIGIMTFTSYFSYFFKGGTSYENHLMMRDMSNADKIAEVFSTLKKIIL